MPELPEVEVCRLGISPHVTNQTINKITVRNPNLRWPVSADIEQLSGQQILQVERRAKYLLLKTDKGRLLIHLGMSGSLRVLEKQAVVQKHDHVDIELSSGKVLRYNDPRRFGAVLFIKDDIDTHELIRHLGPEPLSSDFNAELMIQKAQNKTSPIKTFVMDNKVVVGVGNIYANEALFMSGIHPLTKTKFVTDKQLIKLVDSIKKVLKKAIKQGGTTLKDFTQADGKPGYFAQSLNVYGRSGQSCLHCKTTLEEIRISNRTTVYCPTCQPENSV